MHGLSDCLLPRLRGGGTTGTRCCRISRDAELRAARNHSTDGGRARNLLNGRLRCRCGRVGTGRRLRTEVPASSARARRADTDPGGEHGGGLRRRGAARAAEKREAKRRPGLVRRQCVTHAPQQPRPRAPAHSSEGHPQAERRSPPPPGPTRKKMDERSEQIVPNLSAAGAQTHRQEPTACTRVRTECLGRGRVHIVAVEPASAR